MSKVITFSRQFPAYHPRKGEPTYFVEKIAKSLHLQSVRPWDIPDEIFNTELYYLCEPQNHTIRAGNRWKLGDKFSPRVWSGKPYRSPQIEIAPDIEIKKVWDIKIFPTSGILHFKINGMPQGQWHPYNPVLQNLAANDGLTAIGMIQWFVIKPNTDLQCQIICWNENIQY